MSKKKMIVALVVFNALMIVAFILSNIYVWDFINNMTSQWSYGNGVAIPIINIDAFQVTGETIGWTSDGIQVPRPLPAVIPNYPFFIFWVAMLGNLVLAALILRNWSKSSNL